MVKAKEIIQNEQPVLAESKPSTMKHVIYKLGLAVVLVVAGYGLWKNPQVVDKTVVIVRSWMSTSTPDKTEVDKQMLINNLQQQVNNLQNEMNDLKNRPQNQDFNQFNEKFAALEKTNLNIIDSKADVATVLGLLTRVDKTEQKIDTMAKVTDEGALILTAAMLVKDSAEQGGSFEYEAEVLQQIAENNTNVKESIAVIVKNSAQGIKSRPLLMSEFKAIYKKILQEQKEAFDKNWKDRINSKINEIIKVKNTKKDVPEFEADKSLQAIKRLVEAGNLANAIELIQRPENSTLLANESLKNWVSEAKARIEFDKALSKISAGSLAIMKVNFIKKETNND